VGLISRSKDIDQMKNPCLRVRKTRWGRQIAGGKKFTKKGNRLLARKTLNED